VAYGYNAAEVPLDPIPKLKMGVRIEALSNPDPNRPVVKVSTGPHWESATQPHPNPGDAKTLLPGICKRFVSDFGEPTEDMKGKFKNFVEDWCVKNLIPLSPDTDTTFETWIAARPYSRARKEQLRKALNEVSDVFCRDIRKVKSFMKDEVYPKYKHARGINSRTDGFKAMVGPIFSAIEKEVFALPDFIKKVPVPDRPKYMMERLYAEGATYVETDYTAFEALFKEWLMVCCEFVMYKYMTQFLPEAEWFARVCDDILAGDNECLFKFYRVWVRATRMSGEMCTSLGNGFTNKMALEFVCSLKGSNVVGVVEGDDGAARIDGPVPTTEDFAALGLDIKLIEHHDISTMSFCGIVYDPVDMINVTNPLDVLAEFGWTTTRYVRAKDAKLKQLLKAKCLSLAHQYPGCPIIQPLAEYGLRVTRNVTVGKAVLDVMNQYEKHEYLRAVELGSVHKEIPFRTRLLVEKLYDVSVAQQLQAESYLREKVDLSPISLPAIEAPDSWSHYMNTYTGVLGKNPSHDFPIIGQMENHEDIHDLLLGRGVDLILN
jgi:hypothetical protein